MITKIKDNVSKKIMRKYIIINNKLKEKSGEGFIDSAVKILIAVVIGGLLLAGLYLLFDDTILPTLKQRITDMFNYKG
jgi:hypothetical protein